MRPIRVCAEQTRLSNRWALAITVRTSRSCFTPARLGLARGTRKETGSLPAPAPNSLASRELGNQPRVPLFLLPGEPRPLNARLALPRGDGAGPAACRRVARLQPGFLFSQTPAACCLASQLREQRASSAFSVSSLPARPRSQGRMLRGCEPHCGCVASKPHGLLVGSGTDPLAEELSAPRAGLLNVPQGPHLGPPLLPPDAPRATLISQGCILEDGPSCGEGGPNVHRRHRQDQGWRGSDRLIQPVGNHVLPRDLV